MGKTFEKFGAETMNRYYIGADHIASAVIKGRNSQYTDSTVESAVDKAKIALAKDASKDAVIIVQIVAVVYRDNPPVIVDHLDKE